MKKSSDVSETDSSVLLQRLCGKVLQHLRNALFPEAHRTALGKSQLEALRTELAAGISEKLTEKGASTRILNSGHDVLGQILVTTLENWLIIASEKGWTPEEAATDLEKERATAEEFDGLMGAYQAAQATFQAFWSNNYTSIALALENRSQLVSPKLESMRWRTDSVFARLSERDDIQYNKSEVSTLIELDTCSGGVRFQADRAGLEMLDQELDTIEQVLAKMT